MRATFANHLSKSPDSRMVIVLADIGRYQFRDFPQERVIDVGISEQTAIDIAAGLSLSGMCPVVYGIAPFIVERAYEQIKIAAYNAAAITIVTCGASYDYGTEGATHHCPNDVDILSLIPGMRIYTPGTGNEACRLFDRVHGKGMNYIRLSDYENASTLPVNPNETCIIQLYENVETTVVAFGNTLDAAREAIGDRRINLVYATEYRDSYKDIPGSRLVFCADFAYPGLPHLFANDVLPRGELTKDLIKSVREGIEEWDK